MSRREPLEQDFRYDVTLSCRFVSKCCETMIGMRDTCAFTGRAHTPDESEALTANLRLAGEGGIALGAAPPAVSSV